MFKLIIASILMIFTLSCLNQNTEEKTNCCKASSSMIFWQSDSETAEEFLKNILTENKIDYKDLTSQNWDSESSTIGGIRDYKLSKISTSKTTWNSLMLNLNSTLNNKIALELSKKTESIVIMFLEFDEDAWGYCLFENGKLIDNFWNSPISVDLELEKCSANIDLVSEKFKVSKDRIKPYLNHISESSANEKVFPDDEYELGNHWVRTDLMNKLGLEYPESGKWIYIVEEND